MVALIVIVGLVLMLIVLISAVVQGSKQGKALKRKWEELGAIGGVSVKHVEGLGLAAGAPCEIFRFDDRLLIDAHTHKFEIKYDRLRAAVVKSEQELVEKGKSVVGRAVIGTLLVPGLGTIVGGMSGIGNKTKNGKKSHYMIFNFIDIKGEMSAVTFQDGFTLAIDLFCKNVNQSISQVSTGEVIQL